MSTSPPFARSGDSRVGEKTPVQGGVAAPRLDSLLQMLQLDGENRALNTVHPVVESFDGVLVSSTLAPRPKQPHCVGVRRVTGHRRATLAERAQVLRGIEAEAADVAD